MSKDWKKRESLSSALIQVGATAIVLTALVAGYVWKKTRDRDLGEILRQVRQTATADNPQDLRKALEELEGAFAIDDDSGEAHAIAADLHTELWLTHRIAESEAKARASLKIADDDDANLEERYVTHALHLIADGKAAEAEQYIDDLRKKGASGPRLTYAAGRAYQALGNVALARQALAMAADKVWRNPRFSAAYAEALLEEGQAYQALDALSKALTQNKDHLRSRALAKSA